MLAAVGLALPVAACATGADPASQASPPSAVRETVVAAQPVRAVGDPVRLRIPSLGLSTSLIPLRLDRRNKLIAPERFDVAGWNRSGPEPGERGAAVIAGHVDSRSGPAVFHRLGDLRPGAAIHVDTDRGRTLTFTARGLERHAKTAVPDSVYRPTPTPELRLITCGGTFDPTRRSYRDNVIVHAHLDP